MEGLRDNVWKLSTLILQRTFDFDNTGERRKYSLSIKTTFVIFLLIHTTSATVQWKIKESMIVLGKPLNLECTTSSTNNRNVSRRWTGGAKNRLLCFNGVTINPQKYEETEESSNKYTLQIKETTEDDLDCSYSCRFGFQSDEKILYVTENNFNYIPNENPSDIEYGLKGDNYTLHFEFKKVFPEPVCRIPLKNTLHNLTKIKETKVRIFYHVSYQLESRDPLHTCGDDLKINCTFGSDSREYTLQHNLSCAALDETKSSLSCITVSLLVSVVTLYTMAVLVYLIYNYMYMYRGRNNGKQYTQTKIYVQSEKPNMESYTHLLCCSCHITSDLDVVGGL